MHQLGQLQAWEDAVHLPQVWGLPSDLLTGLPPEVVEEEAGLVEKAVGPPCQHLVASSSRAICCDSDSETWALETHSRRTP